MSNVIQFLESMGSNALMARMSMSEYESAVNFLAVSDEERSALRDRDCLSIGDSVGARQKMMFWVFSPEQEENTPAPEDDPGEQSPTPDDSGASQE